MTVLAIAPTLDLPADLTYPALLDAQADAVATYNRTFREGYPQAERLRAAETIRRVERAIGHALHRQPDCLPTADAAPYLAMAVGTDADFDDAIRAAYGEHNLARTVITRHLGQPGHAPGWIPDPGDRTTAARNRRHALIRELHAAGRRPRSIAELIGSTEARVRTFLETQEA